MIDSDTSITKAPRRLTVSGKLPVQRPASLSSSKIEEFTEQVRLPGASYRIVLNCKGIRSDPTKTKKSQGSK